MATLWKSSLWLPGNTVGLPPPFGISLCLPLHEIQSTSSHPSLTASPHCRRLVLCRQHVCNADWTASWRLSEVSLRHFPLIWGWGSCSCSDMCSAASRTVLWLVSLPMISLLRSVFHHSQLCWRWNESVFESVLCVWKCVWEISLLRFSLLTIYCLVSLLLLMLQG